MKMTIEIYGPDFDGFSMKVNGTTLMECLSEKEVKDLTIGEIMHLTEEPTMCSDRRCGGEHQKQAPADAGD